MGINSSKSKPAQSKEAKQNAPSVKQNRSDEKQENQNFENNKILKSKQSEQKSQFQVKLQSKQKFEQKNKILNESNNEDELRMKNEKSKSKEIKNEKQKSNSKNEIKSIDTKVEGISNQKLNSYIIEKEYLNDQQKKKEEKNENENSNQNFKQEMNYKMQLTKIKNKKEEKNKKQHSHEQRDQKKDMNEKILIQKKKNEKDNQKMKEEKNEKENSYEKRNEKKDMNEKNELLKERSKKEEKNKQEYSNNKVKKKMEKNQSMYSNDKKKKKEQFNEKNYLNGKMKRKKNEKEYSNDQRNDKDQKKENENLNDLINDNEQKNGDDLRIKNEKENKESKSKSKDINNQKQKPNSKDEIKSFDTKVEEISEQKSKSKNIEKGNSNDQNIFLDINNSTIQNNLNMKLNKNKNKNENEYLNDKLKNKNQDGKQNQKEEMKQKETDKSNEIEKYIKEVDQSKIDRNNKHLNIILQSNSLSENEKEIQLLQINENLIKSQLDELEKIKDFSEFQIILTYFDKFNSQIEKTLLDIIEIFINCGDQQYQDNIFFQPIEKSGLLEMIINQIKKQVKEEETNKYIKQYSELLEQLVRIYLKIQKKLNYEIEIINLYVRILDMNIGYFIETLRSNQIDNNEIIINQQQIEEDLKRFSQQIHSFDLIKDYSWNISYESTRIYRESILSLIHINCPQELHCTNQIILPDSPYIQQFKAEILQSVIGFCTTKPTFYNYLLKQHNLLLHLSPLFNYFTNSNKLKKQEKFNRYQQILVIPPSQILRTLKLLNDFLQQHNLPNKYIASIPDLFSSLLNILKHQFDLNAITEGEINNISDIICISLDCISQIQNNNSEMQIQLSKIGYIHSLISIISTSNEQNQISVESALTYFKNFIQQINFGGNQQFSLSKQQISLLSSDEQFEEEGANEEISAQLANKSKNARNEALEIYHMILNHFDANKSRQKTWDDDSSSSSSASEVSDSSSASEISDSSSSDSFEDDKWV